MKVPRVTGIIAVVVLTLSLLNFILKSYAYFVIIVNHTHNPSGTSSSSTTSNIAQNTGDLDHPSLVFVPLLTFIPTKSPVIFRPWVFFTSGLIENGLFSFMISLMLLFYLGRYIETLWGTHEYMKFVGYVIFVNNVSLWVFYSIKTYFANGVYVAPVVKGTTALVMGLLVAVKQRIGNHYVIFFLGKVRIKVNYNPLALIGLTLLGYMIDNDYVVAFHLSLVSFVSSWVYLRFWKTGANERHSFLLPIAMTKQKLKADGKNGVQKIAKNGPNTMSDIATSGVFSSRATTGDRSAQFEFATFFPPPLSHLVAIFSSAVFKLLVRLQYVNPNEFGDFDEDDLEIDNTSFEVISNLRSSLFDLSPLKGARDVNALPESTSNGLKKVWEWISRAAPQSSIKFLMDKRRKLAMRELD